MTVLTPSFQQTPLTFRGSLIRELPRRNWLREGGVESVTGMGGTVERAERDQIERVINHTVRKRFSLGAVERAVLLEHGDDPAIEPGQLMVRVFLPVQ
jgi:hypothetical protein